MDRAIDVRRVAVTSVVRNARPTEISGYLRIVDLEHGRVSFVTPVPESDWRTSDPNPRGGVRGTRGVSVHGDRLALVNAERLFVFDTSWRLVSDFTSRLMSEVHDVLALNGLGRGSEGLPMSFGRVVSPLHAPGERFRSAIVRLAEDSWTILHRPSGVNVPNHNVAEDGTRLVYNDSTRGCLVAWDREEQAEVATVTIPGDPPFAHGLARAGDGLWLVGSQWPLALHLVDLGRGQIVGSYELGGVRDETVFAICPLPDGFADPTGDPSSFWRRATLGPGVTPIPV